MVYFDGPPIFYDYGNCDKKEHRRVDLVLNLCHEPCGMKIYNHFSFIVGPPLEDKCFVVGGVCSCLARKQRVSCRYKVYEAYSHIEPCASLYLSIIVQGYDHQISNEVAIPPFPSTHMSIFASFANEIWNLEIIS